ncbi:MAG TPA: BatA and WFA domain-containing protein [Ohtaekwangia sp.]
MSFLYPSFLWALGVLLIPVIIHLFNFRKTTRIYFSNTRFLKQVKEASSAKRKLKHYLVLASRLLFLLFLVLTFCQPFIPAQEQLNNRNMILYLDNSQSMSGRMADNTRGLDAGINFIESIIEVFPADTRYKLITNDFAPFSNSFKAKKEILDLLAQVRLSPVSRTMTQVLDRIKQDGASGDREVFWISDFQKSTMGPLPSILDSTLHMHLVPVFYPAVSNVFVDSVYLDNPFAAGGEKNTLRVRMHNDGIKPVDQLNVKLTISGVQAGVATVNIQPKSVGEVAFDLTTNLSGLNRGQISFNDFPITFDNTFYLTLNFTDKIRIVEVYGSGTPDVISKVYGNREVFYYRGFSIDNFNYDELNEADLVVVNGLNTIDPSLSQAISDYVAKAGAVLVIPGAQPDAGSFSNMVQLPLKVIDNTAQAELDRPDFTNPFFENVFEEKSISLLMPKASKVVDWGNDRSAILRFKNDVPFLSRFNRFGTVYLMSCALQPAFTDFYNHALFVPVMYRIAAASKRNTIKPYYNLSESFIQLRVENLSEDIPLKLSGKEEIIPVQRKVGENVFLDIPRFSMSEGFYKVVSKQDTVGLLAFNLSRNESLMDQFTAGDIVKSIGAGNNVSIFEARTTGAFSNEIKERYLGTPLWKYALILAICFVMAEILLIRFLK